MFYSEAENSSISCPKIDVVYYIFKWRWVAIEVEKLRQRCLSFRQKNKNDTYTQ
jgi:hypothetical protein